MSTRIKIRRDTANNWENIDPILSNGEIIYVTDENQIKVGDGLKKYSELQSIGGSSDAAQIIMK